MNYLLESFPEAVKVDGKDYFINSSFRSVLKIHEVLKDKTFSQSERESLALSFFYKVVPPNREKAHEKMVEFLGKKEKTKEIVVQKGRNRQKEFKKDVDFSIDSSMIYSGFRKVFGINLRDSNTHLHWWEFLILFEELCHTDSLMQQAIIIRNKKIDDSMSSQEKVAIQELKEKYSLTSPEEQRREREKQFELFMRGGNAND